MIFKLKHNQPIIILLFILFIFPVVVFGRIGVGIGTGSIQIDKPLKLGEIYNLEFSVLNTGDELGEYEVSVEYQEDASQIDPSREWFNFNPQSFNLEPGKSQLVRVSIVIPDEACPGDYFAYLEGRPIKKSINGQTSIGVAAATKLYFTVNPANIFQKLYYQFIDLYKLYHPWDTIFLVIIFIISIFVFIGKQFNFKIIRKKQ